MARFTVLSGNDLRRTLVQRLTPVVDSLRNLNTVFGARPYQVRLIFTQWTGGERGVGFEEVILEQMILPTPKVLLAGLKSEINPVGAEEEGAIRVTEISPRYTEDALVGSTPAGMSVDADTQFYWEVFYPRADGPGVRRRFTVGGTPSYNATKAQWGITLEKAIGDRSRDGEPT